MAEPHTLPQPYEEIDHTADTGLRVYGETPEACLARLVLGFTALTLGCPEPALAPDATRSLTIRPDDDMSKERVELVVDVLRELLYTFDTEHRLPAACTVHAFDDEGIRLELAMAPFDEDAFENVTDLKAVTYHHARFEPASDGWVAEIIFDI